MTSTCEQYGAERWTRNARLCRACWQKTEEASLSASRGAVTLHRTRRLEAQAKAQVGSRFGRWLVISGVTYKSGGFYAGVRCTCGVESSVNVGALYRGDSKGCRACAAKAFGAWQNHCLIDERRKEAQSRKRASRMRAFEQMPRPLKPPSRPSAE